MSGGGVLLGTVLCFWGNCWGALCAPSISRECFCGGGFFLGGLLSPGLLGTAVFAATQPGYATFWCHSRRRRKGGQLSKWASANMPGPMPPMVLQAPRTSGTASRWWRTPSTCPPPWPGSCSPTSCSPGRVSVHCKCSPLPFFLYAVLLLRQGASSRWQGHRFRISQHGPSFAINPACLRAPQCRPRCAVPRALPGRRAALCGRLHRPHRHRLPLSFPLRLLGCCRGESYIVVHSAALRLPVIFLGMPTFDGTARLWRWLLELH